MIELHSLVLYKKQPARLVQTGEKLTIEMQDGKRIKVRPKDIQLLHPGPLHDFAALQPITGDLVTAWELLSEVEKGDIKSDFSELVELIFGKYTPAAAWATWQHLDDGQYFYGTLEEFFARTFEEVLQEKHRRQVQAAERLAWTSFLDRVQSGRPLLDEDARFLRDVEDLAFSRRDSSRVLRALGRSQRPEVAHALLLQLGYWDHSVDPYPIRLGLSTAHPNVEHRRLPDESRVDLTHLDAFAIDDQGNVDPDDALSLDGDRLWVHIADVSALVPPDSAADLEARARGATLYLPEGMVPMLPMGVIKELGLGLQKISPALSVGLRLDPSGEVADVEIVPSWIQATRTTYGQVENEIKDEPFSTLHRFAMAYRERRLDAGAVEINLPEVYVQVRNGRVEIRPVLSSRSRAIVQEAMFMAGEAAAGFALEHAIPFVFATQDPPAFAAVTADEKPPRIEGLDLAEQFAIRRLLQRSQVRGVPGPHAGIGLPVYSRVTSPLRRYLDLVAHQQLRAFLAGEPVLDEQEVLERLGASQAVTSTVKRAESLARRHWTLVFLMQNLDWVGEAVAVESRNGRYRFIIPELAFETQINLREELPLNSIVTLRSKEVDLPELHAYFEIDVKK
jgi:exoribonuclease-2